MISNIIIRKKRGIPILIAICIALSCYYLFFSQFTVTNDFRLGRIPYVINHDTLIVRHYSSTGPQYYVVDGAKYIRKIMPDVWTQNDINSVDVTGIELTGMSLADIGPGYQDKHPNYLVKGTISGTTYPTFEVQEAFQLTTLIDYLFMGNNLIKYLTGLILVMLFVYLIPIIILVIMIRWGVQCVKAVYLSREHFKH